MEVDGHVGHRRVEARRLDIADRAPLREVGDVRRYVGPRLTTVACQLHEAIVGTGPDQPRLDRRFCDREQNGRIGGAHILRGESAALLLLREVVSGEVWTDDIPALPAVRGSVHVLTPRVHGLVVVRRDVDGKRPLEAVANVARRPTLGVVGPHADRARDPGRDLVAVQNALIASGPDDVVGHRVGHREARLAPPDRLPRPDWNRPSRECVRRSAVGGTVLSVSVDVVRHPGVREGMVHLCDRQQRPMPAPPTVRRDLHATVVADDHAVGQERIDPHVVVVASRDRAERNTAVE